MSSWIMTCCYLTALLAATFLAHLFLTSFAGSHDIAPVNHKRGDIALAEAIPFLQRSRISAGVVSCGSQDLRYIPLPSRCVVDCTELIRRKTFSVCFYCIRSWCDNIQQILCKCQDTPGPSNRFGQHRPCPRQILPSTVMFQEPAANMITKLRLQIAVFMFSGNTLIAVVSRLCQ